MLAMIKERSFAIFCSKTIVTIMLLNRNDSFANPPPKYFAKCPPVSTRYMYFDVIACSVQEYLMYKSDSSKGGPVQRRRHGG